MSKSAFFSDFSTRKDWEKEGVEYTWEGVDGPMFRCRVARNGGGNDRVEKLREKLFAPLRRMRDPSDEVVHKIMRRVFAEACALPGSWQFREREGLKCEGNTYGYELDAEGNTVDGSALQWRPERPKACREDGWVQGVETKPNSIEPDTADNVEKVFTALPELYSQIAAFATNVSNYRQEDLEEDSKNS